MYKKYVISKCRKSDVFFLAKHSVQDICFFLYLRWCNFLVQLLSRASGFHSVASVQVFTFGREQQYFLDQNKTTFISKKCLSYTMDGQSPSKKLIFQ